MNNLQENQEQEQESHMIYIAGDGDSIGAKIGQAILHDDIEALKETSHQINLGQEMVIKWAEHCGGHVISAGGDEFILEMPADCAEHLDTLRSEYANLVGATVTIGVGHTPSEAGKALLFGKLNGKDQVYFFDEHTDQFLYEAHMDENKDEEAQKQDEHYLSSMYEDSEEDYDGEDMQAGDEEYSEEEYVDEEPDMQYEEEQAEEYMPEHEMAQDADYGDEEEINFEDPQGQTDSDPADTLTPEEVVDVVQEGAMHEGAEEEDSEHKNEIAMAMADELAAPDTGLKAKIGEMLEAFKQDKEMLEQAQMENPELYQEAINLLEQMIVVAKLLSAPQVEGQEEQQEELPAPPEGVEVVPTEDDPQISGDPVGKPTP